MSSTSKTSGRGSPIDNVDGLRPTQDNEDHTIGAEPIDKEQPWRNVVKPDHFEQPAFFGKKPASKDGSSNKIRLLAELDSKSR